VTLNINNDFRSTIDAEADKFDNNSRCVSVIQEQHRLSHEGMVFHASGKVTGITNGSNQDFLLAVPAGVFPHLQRFNLHVGAGDIDVLIYEDTVTSDDGATNGELNVNRNSSITPSTVLTLGPTVTDIGTLLHTNWIPPTGAGVGARSGVLDVGNGEEWLLKPATKHLLRVTNNSGGSIDLRYEFVWYEIQWQNAGS
jgi:hypothetical protein